MSKRFLLAAALVLSPTWSLPVESPEAKIAEHVAAQGGQAVRGADGRIVEVSLARTWASDAVLDPVFELKGLKRLDLSLTYVTDHGAERLAQVTGLEQLELFAAEFITDAAVASLRANKRLRRLNLRGTDVTDISLQYAAELTGLESLDVSFTQISDVGLEHLAPLAELQELDLGGTKISGVGFHVLKLLPKLRTLRLQGIQRRNAGICWAPVVTDLELDTISALAGLEELDVGWGIGLGAGRPSKEGRAGGEAECRVTGGTRITDLGLAKLARLGRLRRLDLSGAAISPAGLKALANLPRLERLRLWNVRGLDDGAAPHLEVARGLQSLDLSYTRVGDETLRSLAKLPRLERLYLTATAVTPEGLAAFRAARPACLVSWTGR
jgi:internalin A